MQSSTPDHYATLGLDRRCTESQIRAAYRVLAKQHHPDVNGGARAAQARTQELNAAYEILSDPDRRQAYDTELSTAKKSPVLKRTGKPSANLTQEVHLGILEFLRGTKLDVHVNDPGNPGGPETYELVIPPETAPGARFKISRHDSSGGGSVLVRVKAKPDFRFKVRGSDLRCDLKITFQRAQQGGMESLRSATGNALRVTIPKNVSSGEVIRLPGEGLPKTRGGRGDLLVRITYRPEIRITRSAAR